MRIMKEHLYLISINLTPSNEPIKHQAISLMNEANEFLMQVVAIAPGNVEASVLSSNEVVTQYTLNAEQKTAHDTGLPIDTSITMNEYSINTAHNMYHNLSVNDIVNLNYEAYHLVNRILNFKLNLLNEVDNCKVFITAYPHLLNHNIEETREYLSNIEHLQQHQSLNNLPEKEFFWNDKMEEHALFIRGLLDITEEQLVNQANDFAIEFGNLNEELKKKHNLLKGNITTNSRSATKSIIQFKQQAEVGILNCEIKSMIPPILVDHVLREANHYLRILEMNKSI